MRTFISLLPTNKIVIALVLAWGLCAWSPMQIRAQDGEVIPSSYQGSGSFFNRQLGTALRFNYHTRGYGTQDDVVSLGGMKVFNREGATWFLDGQATLSNDFGGGFNLGGGYRFIQDIDSNLWNFDPTRITGLSFWTDGQSTAADNFFTQLGFSFESLGDKLDIRLNGHFPLEQTKTGDAKLESTGRTQFVGHNLFNATESVTTDTAFNVIDGELARRIHDLEAWAFLGGYQLESGGDDTTGYRVGVRGYAVPDLALSLQVTDDNLYSTNVMFGLTWFVGRTHRGNQPTGTIVDRFREPVLRNDFVATTSVTEIRASGDAAIDPDTGLAKNFLFVDSKAAAGGDGSFENRFRTLEEAEDAQAEFDTVFVVADSVLNPTEEITWLDNIDFIGEGGDIPLLCDTSNFGTVTLPESSPGASSGTKPLINAFGAGPIIQLGNDNVVNNFTVDGGGTAISAVGVANPTLSNLDLNNQTDTAVILESTTATAVVENTVNITDSTGVGLRIDGGSGIVAVGASLTDNEGVDLRIVNRDGGTVTYTGILQDDEGGGIVIEDNTGGTINLTNAATEDTNGGVIENGIEITNDDGSQAAIEITNNDDTTINFSGTVGTTSLGSGIGVDISESNENTSITFADLDSEALNGNTFSVADGGTVIVSSADDTRTIENTGTGSAFINEDSVVPGNAAITINSNIVNTGGGNSVRIANRSDNNVNINGTVTDTTTSTGVSITDNSGGNILFTDLITIGEPGNGAAGGVTLDNNTGTTMLFTGIDIETIGGANGFSATGGGNLSVLVPTDNNLSNEITVAQGIGLQVDGMTIDGPGITFALVDVGDNGTNVESATNGIILRDLDGTGPIAIGGGTNAGDGGTINSAATAILVDNVVPGLTIDNVTIENSDAGNAGAGVEIINQSTSSNATFTGLVVNTRDANAVSIGTVLNSNEEGNITVADLTSTVEGTGDVVSIDNDDSSTAVIALSDLNLTNNGAGQGFIATGGGDIDVTGTNTSDTNSGFAFVASDVEDLTASNFTINNAATTGAGVIVTGLDNNSDIVTLNNFDVSTGPANAVEVSANTDGTVNLTSLTSESDAGNTVFLNNNGSTNINIVDMTAEATGIGNAFTAQDGGVLSVAGNSTVSANTGQGVNIDGSTNAVEIAAAGVTFNDVTVTNGTSTGINIVDTTGTGQVSVGSATLTTASTALNVDNANDVAVANVAIDNSATAGAGVSVTGGSTFVATGTNTISTNTGTALNINSSTIGAGNATFDTVNVNNATTSGIALNTVDGGTVTIGSGANPGDGGTITSAGTGITVNNVESLVVSNVTVDNSGAGTDRGLTVTGQDTGSSVAFSGLTVNSNSDDAIRITSNTDGAISLSNTTVVATGNGNGVFANNNTTPTITITSIDITTDSGVGFTATNGGTITANGTNSITTNTGTGLAVRDITIGSVLDFSTVDTTNATTNAVDIQRTTGGQITVGSSGTTSSITATQDAVIIEDAANVDLVNLDINAGQAGLNIDNTNGSNMDVTANDVAVISAPSGAVDVDHTGAGNLTFTVNNGSNFDDTVNIDTTGGTGDVNITFNDSFVDSSGADVAYTLLLDNTVTNANIGFNNSRLTSDTGSAFDFDSNSNVAKNVTLTLTENIFTSNSGGPTAEVDASGSTIMNTTVSDNTFNGGTDNFDLAANNGTTILNLSMQNNSTSGGTDVVHLRLLNAADFNIVDRNDLLTNNPGVANFMFDSPGNVLTDFDSIPALP